MNTRRHSVAWGGANQPLDASMAARLHTRVADHLARREVFAVDALAGADPEFQIPVRVVSEYAWHALFARQLLLPVYAPQDGALSPALTVQVAPEFACDADRDGVHSDAAIVLDPSRRLVTIAGTRYAGEIKKSIFSYLNYFLPRRGVFPMHCAASIGAADDVALFFGLSGTGKTTLSASPERRLIGDDEHGWSDHGIFNFEGGCYAKCIGLTEEREPQIFRAIRFGTVLENVALDPLTREPRYSDQRFTENTRAAYPLTAIPGSVATGCAGHPTTILFLSADAFGVLPPVARLTTEQALYYFLSGYTAKLAGTEVHMSSGPQATFSSCFGAPFLPLPAWTYVEMLQQRLARHHTRCYLVNTGWSGGPYGVGNRIDLALTQSMVRAVLNGAVDDVPFWTDPTFGFQIPTTISGVPDGVLRPRSTWPDPADYDLAAAALAQRFHANAMSFPGIPSAVLGAGPSGASPIRA